MKDWKEYKLGSISTKIGSGATPRGGAESYQDSGISLIRSQNIYDLKFSIDGLAFIDEKQAEKLKNVTVEKEDILLNITGDSVARVCIVPNNILPARVNQHVSIIRIDRNKANTKCVLYSLINLKQELLSQSEIGATRKALTKGMIENLDISLPPLPEQTAIASILSSLDDKIDLLHRQNETLEKMAEALFRQWFVEEAEEDWEEVALSNYFDLLGGFAFKSKSYLETGKYKVISIKGVQDGYLETNNAAHLDLLPEKLKLYQILEVGDILMSLTGNVGRVCLVDEANCLLNQRVVKIETHNFRWKAFGYFYFRQKDMIERLTYLSKGSAQLNLSPIDTLAQLEAFGSEERIDEFCLKINPLFEKLLKNKTQIHTLTSLRDTLLPKLMSGEVRVEV